MTAGCTNRDNSRRARRRTNIRPLAILTAKIEAGTDLVSHLSKRVAKVDAVDRMLADWGIHHLHLSSTLEASSAFTARGQISYSASFDPTTLYLIGIFRTVPGRWGNSSRSRFEAGPMPGYFS